MTDVATSILSTISSENKPKSDLMNMLTQTMSGGTVQQASRELGADEGQTQSAIAAALPILISALAKNASTPAGAQALHNALASHDGSIFDNLPGFLGQAQSGPGGAILGHVLGNSQGGVQAAIAKASGLDSSAAGSLMTMLAPMVMGALGRQTASQGLDASGLASMLGRERQRFASSSPGLAGLATQLLDRDGDGSVIDDVGGMLGKLFGGR